MQIIEIYKSLQGESSYSGLPCVFVRLAGCNLRCVWCDSEYTFKGGSRLTQEQIEAEVHRLLPDKGLVEITGGEPMLQEREVVPLMASLLASGYTVLLETSGERPLASVPAEVVKIADVKCPDSGEGGTFLPQNLNALRERDELKFVIASRRDYEFARDFVRDAASNLRASVIFSPAFRKDATGSRSTEHCLVDPRDLAEWILADNLKVRLGFQIHKFIWEPSLKGV
jgi:7-carboxy-7-deazaguanine synthase